MLLKRKDTFSVRRGRHCEGVRPSRSARVVGERGAGGSEASPAHRRASEASLEPERLAKPISPAEHRRTEGGSVRRKGGAKLPPPIGTPEQLEELVRCGIGG